MISHCYSFPPMVELTDVEATLLLALWATESLHGEIPTRMDATYSIDEDRRQIVISGDSEAGRTLNRLFVGFLQRELDGSSFRVDRASSAGRDG